MKHDLKETVEVFTDITDRGQSSLTDVTDRLNDPVTEVTDRLNDPFTDATEKMNDTSQTLTITKILPYRGHVHIKRLLIQKPDL